MAKLCVDCVHYRGVAKPKYAPGTILADERIALPDRDVAYCAATHNHVVGDGIESGGRAEPCWEERSVGDPKGFAFHCGPDARYFEPKP